MRESQGACGELLRVWATFLLQESREQGVFEASHSLWATFSLQVSREPWQATQHLDNILTTSEQEAGACGELLSVWATFSLELPSLPP